MRPRLMAAPGRPIRRRVSPLRTAAVGALLALLAAAPALAVAPAVRR